MRLITYLKQINEFQRLDTTDQLYLIKLNLLTVCFYHSMFIYDPSRGSYHEPDTTDPLFSDKDWIRVLNKQFHCKLKQLRNDFIDIFQADDIIIKIFFIILLFSNHMSSNQSAHCSLQDIHSLDIFKAQNIFIDLVYRYCLHLYGSKKAPLLFSRYIDKIIKIQFLVDQFKCTIHDYIDTTKLSPLMESLLV
jgi:hypothetical protein